jgi:hypothetical protein
MIDILALSCLFVLIVIVFWMDSSAFYHRRDEESIARIFKEQLSEIMTMDGIPAISLSIIIGLPFVVGGINILERTDIGYWILHAWNYGYSPLEPRVNVPFILVVLSLSMALSTIVRIMLLAIALPLGNTLRMLRKR